MRFQSLSHRGEPWVLPHLGQRIVKTTVAVFLCLMFYYLRGYRGQDMPTEAAIPSSACSPTCATRARTPSTALSAR